MDDAEAFGVIFEDEPKPEHFEVFPENWDAILMWNRSCTQWRIGMAGPTGLDYNVLQWLFGLYEVPEPKELLEDLRVMEGAVLDWRSRQGA